MGEKVIREWFLMGVGFLLEVMKMFSNSLWYSCTTLNKLKSTKLYILNGEILWYANYISVKLLKLSDLKALPPKLVYLVQFIVLG